MHPDGGSIFRQNFESTDLLISVFVYAEEGRERVSPAVVPCDGAAV